MRFTTNTHTVGQATLNVATVYRPSPGMFNLPIGWYWYWQAHSPNGESLVGVSKGPFTTEQLALEDAKYTGGLTNPD